MKHWMGRGLLLAVLLALLTIPAWAYEIPTDYSERSLEDAVAEFMEANGLDESNYSVSYCNTVTGETYAFNDAAFMTAASTYKLPLNMYYYEMEREGLIAPDAYISRAGTTLDQAHYQSLVHSDNDVSIGMLYNLGEFRDYKNLMRKYFTMEDDEIDYIYYVDNYYCTRMMMDALTYLYEYRADFEEMIGYMKQAQPGEYFKAGVTDYEVAHKYGLFEGAANDVGIIYAPQPFLLAVYTQDVEMSVVSQTAALFTAYNVWQNLPEEEENQSVELEVQQVPKEELPPAEAETPQPEPLQEAAPEPEKEPAPQKTDSFEWWMVAVALGVFLLGGGLVTLLVSPARLGKKYGITEEEEETETSGTK